jgi:NADH-quinone oxidoreductase subunit J
MFWHYFLLFLFVLCTVFVLISENPVHSVLFLILTFCISAAILFIFNVEFLGLIFIIIYVGAIAILFLFVVMMLNVKINSFISFIKVPFILFLSFILFLTLFYFLNGLFFYDHNVITFESPYKIFNFLIDNLGNIDVLGQILFNNFLSCFLIAGLILLVAMVDAISLTLNYRSERKNELVIRQLSRSDNFLSFFK